MNVDRCPDCGRPKADSWLCADPRNHVERISAATAVDCYGADRRSCSDVTIARLRGELAEARSALAKAWDDGYSSNHPGRVNPYVTR